MLMSSALVLLMTPGLAFFYGGLVRRKNILSVFMQCLAAVCVVGLQWVLFGYSLAFGPDHAGLIGDFSFAAMNGVGLEPNADYAATVPHLLFMVYQMMFAVITPALIIGAFAERMKFSAFLVFAVLWATFVYDPLAHWIWGTGGWLREFGALDFAGGAVVHISAGMAALASALVVGKRRGFPDTGAPHNLAFVVLGGALLWFGWFGFNGGSALSAGATATLAFVTTQLGAMAGALVWMALDWSIYKRPTTLGFLSGLIAGLAAITPAAGFVGPHGGSGHRRYRRRPLLPVGHGGQDQVQVRRLARRLRHPRRRRFLGHPGSRAVGRPLVQLCRRRRSVPRTRPPAAGAVGGRGASAPSSRSWSRSSCSRSWTRPWACASSPTMSSSASTSRSTKNPPTPSSASREHRRRSCEIHHRHNPT